MPEAKITALAEKLVKVMEAVGRIPKSGHNDSQNYDFVTDADVLDAVRKALVAQSVATLVSITGIETVPFRTSNDKPQFLTTVKGEITLVAGGEAYTIYGVGQGADSTDKGVYKAITGLLKYALLKTFLVPTGDDLERDGPGGTSAPEDAATGTLTAKQKALIKIKMREAGLEGQQMVAFAADVVGKFSTKEMNSAEMDTLLEALKDEALVEKAKEVKP